jgi:hypothetical protein
MEAYAELTREATENDVVLCVYQTGHRLAKYAPVCVVSGHWSVTPMIEQMELGARSFYGAKMSAAEQAEFLERCRVKWIYFGPNERRFGPSDRGEIPGFTKRVVNHDVTLYSAARS